MKRNIVLGLVITLSYVQVNAFVGRYIAKKALNKTVIIKGVKEGKIILENKTNGKIKSIKWKKLDHYIYMPQQGRGSKTSHGFVRNSRKFWKLFKDKYPETLSNRNKMRILNGKAPVVDKKWMQYFKLHRPFNGQKLEHHHIGRGPFIIPLPQGLHRGKGNNKFWHNNK